MNDWLAGAPMDPAATPADPLPPLAGFPFLHAGACAVIVGPTGGGRSSLIQAGLYDAAHDGLAAAYLGSEVAQGEFNARAAILADRRGDEVDDQLRQVLARVRYLELASVIVAAWELAKRPPQEWFDQVEAGGRERWASVIAERYQLLAIDPLSAVASALDLDFDKSNAEFVRFYDQLVQPLTAAGVTVVLVDNVGHAEDARRRAKGASAKQDRADLTFSCATSANPPGLLIRAHKVRSARAAHARGDEWLFRADDHRIEPRERTSNRAPTFRPTNLMQKVSEAIEHDPGLSKSAIRTTIGSRASNVDLALELLIAEGFIAVQEDGQAHRHHSAKPYRQLDDEHAADDTVSTVSAPCPDRVPDTGRGTVSDRVPPLKGGPVTGHGSTDTPNGTNRVPADDDPDTARAEALRAEHQEQLG